MQIQEYQKIAVLFTYWQNLKDTKCPIQMFSQQKPCV